MRLTDPQDLPLSFGLISGAASFFHGWRGLISWNNRWQPSLIPSWSFFCVCPWYAQCVPLRFRALWSSSFFASYSSSRKTISGETGNLVSQKNPQILRFLSFPDPPLEFWHRHIPTVNIWLCDILIMVIGLTESDDREAGVWFVIRQKSESFIWKIAFKNHF